MFGVRGTTLLLSAITIASGVGVNLSVDRRSQVA